MRGSRVQLPSPAPKFKAAEDKQVPAASIYMDGVLPMKLDLHGMKTKDAVERFISEYNAVLRRGEGRLEIVHGYGSSGSGGDIRKAIIAMCEAHKDKLGLIKGEILGNKGVSVVIPSLPLPPRKYALDAVILAALTKPSTPKDVEDRIKGLASTPEIIESLEAMALSGKVAKEVAGGRMQYRRK